MEKFKNILRSIVLILIISFTISYTYGKIAAEKYLQIMTIRDEESYQRVKKQIYNISTDEVRELVFSKDNYEGPRYPVIDYKVDRVKCYKIKGFTHFIYEIRFTVKDWKTIDSLVYVHRGKVYNTHRKD